MQYQKAGEWLKIEMEKEDSGKPGAELFRHFHIATNNRSFWQDHRITNEDGSPFNPAAPLHQKDIVLVKAFEKQQPDYQPADKPAELVYQDDIIAVFNKPAGMIVYPETHQGTGTMANMVARYYLDHHIMTTVRPLHRLDADTSGLIVYSLSPFFQSLLDEMMALHQFNRQYYATVQGRIDKAGVIKTPIGRDRHDARKMRVSNTGRPAETRYEPIASSLTCSTVRCILKTGRTHQIRVHMASIGHPVINDKLYGQGNGPLQLQAYHVDWISPLTHQPVKVEIAENGPQAKAKTK